MARVVAELEATIGSLLDDGRDHDAATAAVRGYGPAVLGFLVGALGVGLGAPVGVVAPVTAVTAVTEDRHWIQSDDYFIADEPWDHGWMYVHLAKLRQAPTGASRDAKFFQLDDSREVWTAAYWRTRPATAADLPLGALAICFNDNQRDDTYHAPPSKDAARTRAWFLGKVTDTSDVAKGWVRIDTYNCSIDALRVAAP